MENHVRSLLLEAAALEVDAKTAKDTHFSAANRKNAIRVAVGLSTVIFATLLSSKLLDFDLLKPIFGEPAPIWFEPLKVALSWLVSLGTAILSFLGYEKQATLHRTVGNLYVDVAKRARHIIHVYSQAVNPNPDELLQELEKIRVDYSKATHEGDSLFSSVKEQKSALEGNSSRRKKVKEAMQEMDDLWMKTSTP